MYFTVEVLIWGVAGAALVLIGLKTFLSTYCPRCGGGRVGRLHSEHYDGTRGRVCKLCSDCGHRWDWAAR